MIPLSGFLSGLCLQFFFHCVFRTAAFPQGWPGHIESPSLSMTHIYTTHDTYCAFRRVHIVHCTPIMHIFIYIEIIEVTSLYNMSWRPILAMTEFNVSFIVDVDTAARHWYLAPGEGAISALEPLAMVELSHSFLKPINNQFNQCGMIIIFISLSSQRTDQLSVLISSELIVDDMCLSFLSFQVC